MKTRELTTEERNKLDKAWIEFCDKSSQLLEDAQSTFKADFRAQLKAWDNYEAARIDLNIFPTLAGYRVKIS